LESAIIVSWRGWKGSYSDLEGGSIGAVVAKRKMSSQSSEGRLGKWATSSVVVSVVLVVGIDMVSRAYIEREIIR
jgi:hypothetical protein